MDIQTNMMSGEMLINYRVMRNLLLAVTSHDFSRAINLWKTGQVPCSVVLLEK